MAGRRWIALTLGVLIIGLPVAGCGGGGQSDTATASITKAEFVKSASAACAKIHGRAQAEFDALMEGKGGPASGLGALGKKFVIAPKQQEVKEFIALGLPSGGESQVKAIIAAFESGIKEAEQDPTAVAQNSTDAFGEPEKLAAEYGLKGC